MEPIQIPSKVHDRACFLQWIGALAVEPMHFEQAAATLRGADLLGIIEASEKKPPSIYSESIFSLALAMRTAGLDVVLAPQAGPEDTNTKDEAGIPAYAITGGTAVIPVNGPLSKQPSSLSSLFGGSSTLGMRKALSLAMADSRVQRIMFHVDSPGGTVAGTGDLGDDIFAASSKKPIAAYIEDMGTSAAYWLASQASLVYASPYANVGSIGVIWTVWDRSGLFEKAGIKVHAIMSNPGKAFAVDGMPITKAQQEKMQRHVDETYRTFIQTVARGRDVSVEEARKMSGDADIYNAQDAFNRGLVDTVMTLKEAILDFAKVQPQSMLRPERPSMALGRGRTPRVETVSVNLVLPGPTLSGTVADLLVTEVHTDTSASHPEVHGSSNTPAGIDASQGDQPVAPDPKNPAASDTAAAPATLSSADVAELRRQASLGAEAHERLLRIETERKEKEAKTLSDKRDAIMADYGATKEEVQACGDMSSLSALESALKRSRAKRSGADPSAGTAPADAEATATAHLKEMDEGRAAWLNTIKLPGA